MGAEGEGEHADGEGDGWKEVSALLDVAGEEKFVSSSEKKMVLTKSFVFVIDIAGCSEKDYAFIDNQFNYSSIELVKASRTWE